MFTTTFETILTQTQPSSTIARAKAGDLDAFNDLVLKFQDTVYQQAFWMLGDEDAAEDATQEVFIRAYRNMDSFYGEIFKPWILRITTNYCVDQLRSQKRRPTSPLEPCNEYDDEIETPYWLIDQGANVEEIIEQGERESTILECLNELSPDHRIVIILVDLQGMDYREAANVLGIAVAALKSRLFRARVRAREILQKRLNYSGSSREFSSRGTEVMAYAMASAN